MLNRIVLQGRLTRDPEMRVTTSQIPAASFTLAVDRDYKAKDGERGVDFIPCVAWRSTAEFIKKYFAKGQMAIVIGRLQIRPWEDEHGNKRKATEVVAEAVYFGGSKRDSAAASEPPMAEPPAVDGFAKIDDGLPF